jgi:hypothetical protein
VTGRRLSAFIDSLAAGRRPGPFKAQPEDLDELRMAIALRAARPGDATPDEGFVSDLYQKLADQARPSEVSNVHPMKMRRARVALVAVAAGVALVGGTAVVTEATNHPSVTSSAVPVPHGKDLRTATFEAANGTVLGQAVAYQGHPSWIYMNVGLSESKGLVNCMLQLDNGSIVAAGTIHLQGGSGKLSKTLGVKIDRLRGATLYSSTGARLASATFA